MNFETQFEDVMNLVQANTSNRQAWEASVKLLEEIEAHDSKPDESMVCMLASWAIQASGHDEDFHITKRLHQTYDARIRSFHYNTMDPIEFHRFVQNHPEEVRDIPGSTFHNIDAYRAIAFPAMKAYFYYNDTEKAVEAGAWHLFILAVLPREGHPKKPNFPLNGPTVDRLQRMGQVLRGMEDERQAILTRTAELLREADHHLQAEYIESYRSPQMQRILEAGVLAEIETSNVKVPSTEELENDPSVTKGPGGIYFQVNQPGNDAPSQGKPERRVMANEAFSTSATFDEPMERSTKLLIAAGVVIGLGSILALVL